MNMIFDALRNSQSPVILIPSNKSKAINIFRGSYNGQPYAFGMNAEVAYDIFSPGKKLELMPNDKEIASDDVTDTESMKLSDGTLVSVAGDTAIALANEKICSPVTGKPVTIAFDDSEETDESTEEENTEDESTETDENTMESEPETIDENVTMEDDSEMDASDDSDETDMAEEDTSEETPEIQDESEEDTSEEDTESTEEEDTEDESTDEDDTTSEDDTMTDDSTGEDETTTDEIPEEVDVEAASFVTDHNLRFTAFDAVASEVAVFDGDTHVCTLVKKNAHESKRDLFTKPTLAVAFNKAIEQAGFDYNNEALKPYGVKVTKFTVKIPGLTKGILDKVSAETASVAETKNESHNAKLNQTIKLAIMGMAKGTTDSSLINELASAFEVAGVANARTIVAASLHKIAPAFTKQIVETASDLANKSDDYLQGLAEITAKASFVGSENKETALKVVSTNFHLPTGNKVAEVASIEAPVKRKVNIFASIRSQRAG